MSKRPRQLALVLPNTWGGNRPGAGRKPRGTTAEIVHASRHPLDSREPVHVTCRVVKGAPYLRSERGYRAIRESLCAAKDRLGMRIVHFSVQDDHIHLLVEAVNEIALGRAMKGFQVRVARRLNRLAGRTGRVFVDRYHARYLGTPTEVRRALVYVLQNGKKHAPPGERGVRLERSWVDPFSSAAFFDGWREECRRFVPERDVPAHRRSGGAAEVPVVRAQGWLLREGWRRAGGDIDTRETPDGDEGVKAPRDLKRRTSRRKPASPRRGAGLETADILPRRRHRART